MNRTTWTVIGSALAMAACSTANPATPEESDDMAQAIGVTVAAEGRGGDIASMLDAVQLALGKLPRGFSRKPDGHFHCRRFDLDFSFTVTCKDAAGNTLAKCDETTDEATVDVAWSGSLDTPSFDAMVDRIGTWTLTGLQSDTATLDGLSAFTYKATLTPKFRPGLTATYELEMATAYDAIQIDIDSRTPIGGTALFDVNARRTVTGTDHDVDRTFELDAELTFHEDHTATLVIDGTRHYLIDLDTGRVTRID